MNCADLFGSRCVISKLVTESIIPLLPPGRYLFPMTSLNRYLPIGNNEVLVLLVHLGMHLLPDIVCPLLLDFVIIH